MAQSTNLWQKCRNYPGPRLLSRHAPWLAVLQGSCNQESLTLVILVTATDMLSLFVSPLTLGALNEFVIHIATKGFFHLETIIKVLVSCFWFIWIPMLGSTTIRNIFPLTARGSTLVVRIWRLQTKVYPRAVRVKNNPPLLIIFRVFTFFTGTLSFSF